MKNRIYSIPVYGARETNGDNPVMAPEVTMELVKRINGFFGMKRSLIGKVIIWASLFNLAMSPFIIVNILNLIDGVTAWRVIGLLLKVAVIAISILMLRQELRYKPKTEQEISVPPLG